MKVSGETVFITGANRGIGLMLAREALSRGAAKVYAGTRSLERLSEPDLVPIQIDVNNVGSIQRAVAACPDVSILINNAGIAAPVADALAEEVEPLSRRLMETNFYGMMRVTRAFAPVLAHRDHSAIINVLSDASWQPRPALTSYSASKAAAWSFTNHARMTLKDQHTDVLALHVGFVDTDLTAGVNVPKSDPREVARKTLDALEAGKTEVLADEGTVRLKASLSSATPEYSHPLA
jgi:NAD(P)-dependent dehydrogenase (short-subunit alcohol dehydrogenase family)